MMSLLSRFLSEGSADNLEELKEPEDLKTFKENLNDACFKANMVSIIYESLFLFLFLLNEYL